MNCDRLLWRYTTTGLPSEPGIQDQLARGPAGPSSAECDELQQAIHAHATRFLEALWSDLGVPPAAAVVLKDFLRRILREGEQWTSLFIHTTYFGW